MASENNKDVFFVGAGFDKEYSQPLMNDVPDDLESLCKNSSSFFKNHNFLSFTEQRIIKEDSKLQSDLSSYFKIIKDFRPEIQENIEEIIDFAHKYLNSENKHIFFCLFHYVFFLRELCFYRLNKESPELYRKILEKEGSIITTNYTSFSEKEHPKKDDGKILSYFGIAKTLMSPCVLKLHGGVMFYRNNEEITCIFTNNDKRFIRYSEFVRYRGELGEHIDKSGSQLIIPPFKNKDDFISQNREKYAFYENIWKHADNELNGSRLFIIGYSFNNDDETIEKLLKKNKNNFKKIYMVSPGRFNETKARELLGDYESIKCTALEFVNKYINLEI